MSVARYEIQCDMNNHYRFQLISSTGSVLLTSAWFDNKQLASAGIQNAQITSKNQSNYYPAITPDNRYYYDLLLMNGQLIATSHRYLTESLRDATLATTISTGSTNDIVDTCSHNKHVLLERFKNRF